jgi:hypothetical protein
MIILKLILLISPSLFKEGFGWVLCFIEFFEPYPNLSFAKEGGPNDMLRNCIGSAENGISDKLIKVRFFRHRTMIYN